MNSHNTLFLQALRASLKNEKLDIATDISKEDVLRVFSQAQAHKVLALVFDAIYESPVAAVLEPQIFQQYKIQMQIQVMQQAVKTDEFFSLYEDMETAGFMPLVVKGAVCRSIYPKPDYRISSDEDVLVSEEQFIGCCGHLHNSGLVRMKPEQGEDAFEISFGKPGSPVYIELHRALFAPEEAAYGEWNRYFADAFEHKVCLEIDGHKVYTLEYTEHLFYLICHAFKHFVHSGFGIRQVCDMVMYARAFGSQIDWQKLMNWCVEIRAEQFAAAIFKIGENHLILEPEQASYADVWREMISEVDEVPLLEDLLEGGVYGDSSMSRKHSSNMTLNAVADQKKGKKARVNVLRVVFPAARNLVHRYPYLEKRPYLLPIAWGQRLLKYGQEIRCRKDDDAAESVRIGKQRIELLKEYGIIKK